MSLVPKCNLTEAFCQSVPSQLSSARSSNRRNLDIMFYAPVSGFTDLHRAAQRGDDSEVAALLTKVSFIWLVLGILLLQ